MTCISSFALIAWHLSFERGIPIIFATVSLFMPLSFEHLQQVPVLFETAVPVAHLWANLCFGQDLLRSSVVCDLCHGMLYQVPLRQALIDISFTQRLMEAHLRPQTWLAILVVQIQEQLQGSLGILFLGPKRRGLTMDLLEKQFGLWMMNTFQEPCFGNIPAFQMHCTTSLHFQLLLQALDTCPFSSTQQAHCSSGIARFHVQREVGTSLQQSCLGIQGCASIGSFRSQNVVIMTSLAVDQPFFSRVAEDFLMLHDADGLHIWNGKKMGKWTLAREEDKQ